MNSISFKSMYDNPSLPGECLLKPLKSYRCFFLSKEGTLWKLAHCISGLVAYPILGVFAIIGILFKRMSVQETSRQQQAIQNALNKHYPGFKAKPVPGKFGTFNVSR